MAPDSKTVWGSPSAVSWSTIAGILELGDTCATQQTATTVSDHQRDGKGLENSTHGLELVGELVDIAADVDRLRHVLQPHLLQRDRDLLPVRRVPVTTTTTTTISNSDKLR